MKKFMIMLALAISSQWAMAQDNSEKNLVKTFDPKGSTSIGFECKQKEVFHIDRFIVQDKQIILYWVS